MRFFEKSFLLANIKLDIVFGMPFLIISNTDIDFKVRDLQYRFYITKEVLPTTKRIELIWKKKFAIISFDSNHEAFVVHIVAFNISLDDEIYPSKKAQIAHLKVDETLTKVFIKYIDFEDIFSPKLAIDLPDHTSINNYVIELIDNQQPFYSPIYSLNLVKLETLKTYIKNNLTNNFIRPFKFPIRVPIFFDQKPNGSL